MNPYEITVLTSFALRLGAWLRRDSAELQIEGFPPHLDRIYGDLVVIGPASAVLLEFKRNKDTIATEERKELRQQLLERLQRDEGLRRVSLWCHWFCFLHNGVHKQSRYLPELSRKDSGDRFDVILRQRLDFDAFAEGLYDTGAPQSGVVLPQLNGVGATHGDFYGYLRELSDLAGTSDAKTAAMCLEIEEGKVRLRVVHGFRALAESLEPRIERIDEQSTRRLPSP